MHLATNFQQIVEMLSKFQTFFLIKSGGGRVVQWCGVNFQCRASYTLDYSRERAYCAFSRRGWAVFFSLV